MLGFPYCLVPTGYSGLNTALPAGSLLSFWASCRRKLVGIHIGFCTFVPLACNFSLLAFLNSHDTRKQHSGRQTPQSLEFQLEKLVSLRSWAIPTTTNAKRKRLLFPAYPPSLSISIAISSSAVSYVLSFSLRPHLAAANACSPAATQSCLSGWARRTPGIRQRASELREHPHSCSPSFSARIRPMLTTPANCQERDRSDRSHLPADEIHLCNVIPPPPFSFWLLGMSFIRTN